MKYPEKKIEKLLDGIFDGSITQYDLPLDYYNAVVEYLKAGLYKGFGMDLEQAIGKDYELLAELRENVYMFGAAKTYQEVKDISSLLLDDDGNLRSRSDFNQIGRERYDMWNDDWGKTEYNTAVGQGQMAVKWNEIEKQKEVLPLLRYSAIGDACSICAPLNGMTAPVSDPVWDSVAPLNHFNCFCTLEQLDEFDGKPTEGNEDLVAGVEEKMNPIFINNAGKSGEVFTKDHPYFDVPKEDKGCAAKNFDLPIPEKD